MTIVQTSFPEAALLEALRTAMQPTSPQDDPGLSIKEIARALYDNDHAGSRDRVSAMLKAAMAAGTVKRGWRHSERIDGQPYRIPVFRDI